MRRAVRTMNAAGRAHPPPRFPYGQRRVSSRLTSAGKGVEACLDGVDDLSYRTAGAPCGLVGRKHVSRSMWAARVGMILLATISVGALAAPAEAASSTGVASVVEGTKVQYKAGKGKTNKVVVTRSGRTVTIDDRVTVKAGKGCKAVKGDKTKVRCTTSKTPTRVRVYLYDLNDSVVDRSDLPMTADGGTGKDTITGGPKGDLLRGGTNTDHIYGLGGNDRIEAGSGNDHLYGGDGNDHLIDDDGNDVVYGNNGNDWFEDGNGNDKYYGGAGNDSFDLFQPHGSVKNHSDLVSGGAGDDYVSFAAYSKGISVSLDGKANDGLPGEHDNIGRDVESIFGGFGNDHLYGGPEDDFLEGNWGDDVIYGEGGNDTLVGQQGSDKFYGGAGDDALLGDDYEDPKKSHDALDGGTNGTRGDACYPTTGDTVTNCEQILK
jgi:serralysin